MPEHPSLPIPATPEGTNGRRAPRGARRTTTPDARTGSVRVHDFIPIEEHHLQAGTVLVSGSGSWLTRPATEALAGSDGVAIEFGEPRMIERGVVVALHWAATGPFANLNAHLRLDPMPPARSHLSFKGSYEVFSSEADRNDAITAHHLTESCVRRFLVGVAVALERSAPNSPSSAQREAFKRPCSSQGPEPMRQTMIRDTETPRTKRATRRELQ